MKTNTAFLFCWAIFCSCFITSKSFAQPCLPNGIAFTTQAQIDAFPNNYPGCTQILGNVAITDQMSGSITNLNGLAQLNSIGGYLAIYNNASLSNFSGLNSINSIGGLFQIDHNPSLTDISIFEELTSIGGNFRIFSNNSLTNISTFNALTLIGGSFSIST